MLLMRVPVVTVRRLLRILWLVLLIRLTILRRVIILILREVLGLRLTIMRPFRLVLSLMVLRILIVISRSLFSVRVLRRSILRPWPMLVRILL